MQTLIQVLASKSGSLRQKIVNDGRLKNCNLSVSREKKKGRTHGWAKIHSEAEEGYGAINMEWYGRSRMLICRVITRNSSRKSANVLIADFIRYLLAYHGGSIQSVNILPR
jgi:hypothetical protein